MASYVIADKIRAPVKTRCKELTKGFEDSEIDEGIRAGVLVYSRYRKRIAVSTISGDAGYDYPINSTNLPGYIDGFSFINDIEFPYSSTQADPNFLERDDWTLYDDGTNLNVRFITATPAASEQIRFNYDIPRLDDVDDAVDIIAGVKAVIVDTDFFAVCDIAAAAVLRQIAAKLIATGDSTLQADVVNYRSKSAECTRLAEELTKAYSTHMGLDDDAEGARGASVDVDFDTEFAFGTDHITHPRRWV